MINAYPAFAEKKTKLYENIAGELTRLIDRGTFKPGDRIPSVRVLSQQHNVSITTAIEAYRLLEDRGIIEARPQSGYFVRPPFRDIPAEPEMTKPASAPSAISHDVKELVMRVLQDTRDPGLVPLGAAVPNPELLPTEKLNRALAASGRTYSARGISYDVPPGCLELREQIAKRLLFAGCAITPDDIMITSGCLEAIGLALRAVCRPGDAVAIESPAYFGFLQSLDVLGLRAVEIPTHPRDGVSLEALRYAVEENQIRACLFTTNYSNPLGCCMPDENKKKLVALLSEYNIPLIEDDIYGDFSFSKDRPRVAKAHDKKGLVLLCSSFSKTLAPGYRVGWIAPGKYAPQVHYLKLVSNIATSTLPPLAIAHFLANGGYDHYLRKIRRTYADQVALLSQSIAEFFPPGTKATRPAGGFLLWVELPEYADALELYRKALREGISLAPGHIFSAKKKYKHFIRLNCAHWSPKVKNAVKMLGRLVAEQRSGS